MDWLILQILKMFNIIVKNVIILIHLDEVNVMKHHHPVSQMSNDPSQLGDPLTPRRGRSITPRPMSRNNSSDPEKVDNDDYDDDGVAVSKALASRSSSRKRSQTRLGDSRRGSSDDVKPYSISDDESVSREE
jgi:hypothetical protein